MHKCQNMRLLALGVEADQRCQGTRVTMICGDLRDTRMGVEHESGLLSQLQWTWDYPKEEGSQTRAYKGLLAQLSAGRSEKWAAEKKQAVIPQPQMPGSHSVICMNGQRNANLWKLAGRPLSQQKPMFARRTSSISNGITQVTSRCRA